MVITVTLNPAMDKTLTVPNFTLGNVNRAESLRYDCGGKGLNVSKVLKNFNIDSTCTGFLGGIWENTFRTELEKRKIIDKFMSILGETRTNTKVVDNINAVYTDINEAGPQIDEQKLSEFIENFNSLCKADDIVILSGGVCPGIPKDIYKRLTENAKQRGAYVILDAEGELLQEGIKAKPDVIKPNEHELGMIFDIDEDNENELIDAAKSLHKQGVGKILISMGAKGGMYVTQDRTYFAEGLKVPVKSTVGAGDSMVAALVYSKIKGFDDAETLKFATACGAASVSLEGTEACTIEQVNELLNQVKIEFKEVF